MKLKIEKLSKVVLFLVVAIVAVLTAVNYFVAIEGTIALIAPAFVFGIALFVFIEVGYFKGFKDKDLFRMAGAIVAIVAIIGVILELIPGMPVIAALNTVKGGLSALLALYFVVEGFR